MASISEWHRSRWGVFSETRGQMVVLRTEYGVVLMEV